jgi:TetR/AcrR family transcriptional repressor of bet genes
MTPAVRRNSLSQRTASKEARQAQLIKATIRSIAKRGLSDTTIATVAKEAGLSQGIINLHFQSKDRLLVETLRYVADEYTNAWRTALNNAGPSSAEKLAAVIEADFGKAVCDRNKISVWFAFWGESKSRPTYRKICTTLDQEHDAMLTRLCADLMSDGGYSGIDAENIATALSAMGEGLWLDLLVNPESMDRERAKAVCFGFLANVFPDHFGVTARVVKRENQTR